MRDKVRLFLQGHVSPGAHVIAAVSGGRDSMALLHVLLSLEDEMGFRLTAAHFNHNLRGDESRRDEDFVRSFCRERSIGFVRGDGDVAGLSAESGVGTEDAARRLRYRFLSSIDPEAWVLTAHNAQDNLETLLMRLLRGASLHGLAGIPPVRGRILRPMLEVSREEIDEYLSRNGIPFIEDSTNQEDNYLRNRLRHHVVPLLLREDPAVLSHTAALCQILRREDDYLSAETEKALDALVHGGRLSCPGLLSLHGAMQYRVMAAFLRKVPSLSGAHLDAALDLCRSGNPSAGLDLPEGFRLLRRYAELELIRQAAGTVPEDPVPISPGQQVSFGPWTVRCSLAPAPEDLTGIIALPAASHGLTLRTRKPGDRIRLSGGTKKLSDLMIDKKIPARWRDTLPVVWNEDRILAVLPLTASPPRPPAGETCLLLHAVKTEE